MITHTTEIRVRYADTDQMQFVYNGKYFEYFEVGRTEMLRDLNLPYHKIEESGYQMPVVEAHINYKNPAYYDEILTIETSVNEIPSLRIKTNYRIFSRQRNVLICEGYIVLVFINIQTGKVSKPPQFFIQAINEAINNDKRKSD